MSLRRLAERRLVGWDGFGGGSVVMSFEAELSSSAEDFTARCLRIWRSGVTASEKVNEGRVGSSSLPRCLCWKASCFCFSLSRRNFYQQVSERRGKGEGLTSRALILAISSLPCRASSTFNTVSSSSLSSRAKVSRRERDDKDQDAREITHLRTHL